MIVAFLGDHIGLNAQLLHLKKKQQSKLQRHLPLTRILPTAFECSAADVPIELGTQLLRLSQQYQCHLHALIAALQVITSDRIPYSCSAANSINAIRH